MDIKVDEFKTRPDIKATLIDFKAGETKRFYITGPSYSLLHSYSSRLKKEKGYEFRLNFDPFSNIMTVIRIK